MTSRRTFLLGMAGILATATAPGIIRAGSLMPIKDIWANGTLTEALLEEACIRMMQATDRQGRRLGLFPTELIVPLAMLSQARRLAPEFFKVIPDPYMLKGQWSVKSPSKDREGNIISYQEIGYSL